jgi:hypothetical protein
MKRVALATCAVCALVVLAGPGRSGDDKDLRAIINKAVAAHGGEANLAKYPAQTMKFNGKFHGMGDPIDFTMDIAFQKKQFRFGMDMKVMGFDLKIISALNGDKGWNKVNDEVKDMPAEEVTEHKEQMHIDKVISLLPLKSKDYKLSSLGDVKVGDQPAVGVRVSRDGHRDVNLFFDQAKGRLVKSEYIVKDFQAGAKEVNQANFYSEYKEFQGTRHPTRVSIERDGKKYVDAQMTEIQLLEKLDDSMFDRP